MAKGITFDNFFGSEECVEQKVDGRVEDDEGVRDVVDVAQPVRPLSPAHNLVDRGDLKVKIVCKRLRGHTSHAAGFTHPLLWYPNMSDK